MTPRVCAGLAVAVEEGVDDIDRACVTVDVPVHMWVASRMQVSVLVIGFSEFGLTLSVWRTRFAYSCVYA